MLCFTCFCCEFVLQQTGRAFFGVRLRLRAFFIAETVTAEFVRWKEGDKMSTYKRVFTLRMREEVFDKLGVLAQQEHRNLTNCIEYILLQYLNSQEDKDGQEQEKASRK